VRKIANSTVFALDPATLETPGNFHNSRVCYSATDIARSVVYNWSYDIFLVLRKKTFGLELPMHRSGSNWTRVYILCNKRSCQISSTSVNNF